MAGLPGASPAGRTVDLLTTKNGKRIAVEIETGKSDAAANVRKCLDAGLGKVIVVATSRKARDAIAATLSGNPTVNLTTGSEAISVPAGGSFYPLPRGRKEGRCRHKPR